MGDARAHTHCHGHAPPPPRSADSGLRDATNGGARPEPQQARPKRGLGYRGDISNQTAASSQTAQSAKKGELPPVECMHACAPAPPTSFDVSASARPEAVARAAGEHRAPIFGSAAARGAPVPPLTLEQVPAFPGASPWRLGASPGPMPAFRGVAPSPFALGASSPGPLPAFRDAPPSPKMELDLTFAQLAPQLSKLQVSAPNDSDEDMELED